MQTLSPGSTDIDTSEYWTGIGTLTSANTLDGDEDEAVGNPTASRMTLISPTTRHIIHLGTETTIGDPTTQDDMFVRFSTGEQLNQYTPLATNAAGTQRLQDGTRIIGALKAKETIFVDDLKENTAAANRLGIHTWNLIPGQEDITQLFLSLIHI